MMHLCSLPPAPRCPGIWRKAFVGLRMPPRCSSGPRHASPSKDARNWNHLECWSVAPHDCPTLEVVTSDPRLRAFERCVSAPMPASIRRSLPPYFGVVAVTANAMSINVSMQKGGPLGVRSSKHALIEIRRVKVRVQQQGLVLIQRKHADRLRIVTLPEGLLQDDWPLQFNESPEDFRSPESYLDLLPVRRLKVRKAISSWSGRATKRSWSAVSNFACIGVRVAWGSPPIELTAAHALEQLLKVVLVHHVHAACSKLLQVVAA